MIPVHSRSFLSTKNDSLASPSIKAVSAKQAVFLVSNFQ